MPMRPAPLHVTGPSLPRIAVVEPISRPVRPDLGEPSPTVQSRVGTVPKPQPQPQPHALSFVPTPSIYRLVVRSIHAGEPRDPQQLDAVPGERRLAEGLLQATFHDGVPPSRDKMGARDKRRKDHRQNQPRSKRCGSEARRDDDTMHGNTRLSEKLATVAESRDRGLRAPRVSRRVPFHAAFADDPAFHRPDQKVVADDNTEENHRREVPPAGDNLGDNDSAESQREVCLPSEITETRTAATEIADSPDTNAGCGIDILDAASIPDETHAEETQKKKVSTKSEIEFVPVHRSRRRGKENLEFATRGEYDGVDVAQVTGSVRQRHTQKRQRRRVDEKTGGLLFVLYLLALPILCATNGPPQNNRGSLAYNSSSASGERHPYHDYSWEVNQINPWLSACDLAGPAPADLQGSCGPPETPKNCPDACRRPDTRTSQAADPFFAVVSQAIGYRKGGCAPRTETETGGQATPEQCLFYLEESHKTEICRDNFGMDSSKKSPTVRENRYRFLSGLRLRHCCEHAALNALAPGKGGPLEEVLGGNDGCRRAIGKLLAVDALAARLHCEFGEVLARYDCGQPYSVIYNCSHCKEAYRRWVCSSLVPYFAHDEQPCRKDQVSAEALLKTGMRIRPCRSFCQTVEQRCPYLLPGDRAPAYPTQYAGEPTFLCRDPNIPETGEQALRALHADEECCFHVCSDDDPGLGVCTNCTELQIEMANRQRDFTKDPSTAPQCELNSATSTSSGQHQSTVSSSAWSGSTTESGSSLNPNLRDGTKGLEVSQSSGTSHQSSASSTSFCGTGGVGSMSSSGSGARLTSSSIAMCAFCAWGALIGMCTINLATSPLTTGESIAIRDDGRRRDHLGRSLYPGKTIYLVIIIFSCTLLKSILLNARDILYGLSSAYKKLFNIKPKRSYNRDLPQLDDIEVRGSTVNPNRPRRRRRRGCKRRRKKKRRRAS